MPTKDTVPDSRHAAGQFPGKTTTPHSDRPDMSRSARSTLGDPSAASCGRRGEAVMKAPGRQDPGCTNFPDLFVQPGGSVRNMVREAFPQDGENFSPGRLIIQNQRAGAKPAARFRESPPGSARPSGKTRRNTARFPSLLPSCRTGETMPGSGPDDGGRMRTESGR
jgi:hypothetical protein